MLQERLSQSLQSTEIAIPDFYSEVLPDGTLAEVYLRQTKEKTSEVHSLLRQADAISYLHRVFVDKHYDPAIHAKNTLIPAKLITESPYSVYLYNNTKDMVAQGNATRIDDHAVSLGLFVAENNRGKGYASYMSHKLIDVVKKDSSIEQCVFEVTNGNIAMRKVVLSLRDEYPDMDISRQNNHWLFKIPLK
jgi:hypothetical protein